MSQAHCSFCAQTFAPDEWMLGSMNASGNMAARALRPRLLAHGSLVLALLAVAGLESRPQLVWAALVLLLFALAATLMLRAWPGIRPALFLHLVEALLVPAALLSAATPAPLVAAACIGLVSANCAQGGLRLGALALSALLVGVLIGAALGGLPPAGGDAALWVTGGLLLCHGMLIGQLGFMQNARLAALRQRERDQSRQLERVATVLGRYLSPQVRAALFDAVPEAGAPNRRRWVTVFFSDISGFTRMTETLDPEELSDYLNQYLEAMACIALEHGGTVDKFIGDGVMVFFGDPQSRGRADDARACVHMAVAMRQRLEQLAVEWQRRGALQALRVRIGIASGYCTAGSFGCAQRMDYTIIGPPVNLASRLEALAGDDQILLSRATWSLIRDHFGCRRLGWRHAKGFADAFEVFEVADDGSHDQIDLDVPGFLLTLDMQQADPEFVRQRLAAVLARLEHRPAPGGTASSPLQLVPG